VVLERLRASLMNVLVTTIPISLVIKQSIHKFNIVSIRNAFFYRPQIFTVEAAFRRHGTNVVVPLQKGGNLITQKNDHYWNDAPKTNHQH
jgi:hypothetical protein